ncbi:hypothetical protein JK192_12325 [Gluconobacter cerinus]|nr:hypothetical protein [Gluconobacter cerinus]MBS1032163.1 hypothetical protein [Gluconobacter cerinus]
MAREPPNDHLSGGHRHDHTMNTELHAVTYKNGCALTFSMTARPVSDYKGASALLDSLPIAQ